MMLFSSFTFSQSRHGKLCAIAGDRQQGFHAGKKKRGKSEKSANLLQEDRRQLNHIEVVAGPVHDAADVHQGRDLRLVPHAPEGLKLIVVDPSSAGADDEILCKREPLVAHHVVPNEVRRQRQRGEVLLLENCRVTDEVAVTQHHLASQLVTRDDLIIFDARLEVVRGELLGVKKSEVRFSRSF